MHRHTIRRSRLVPLAVVAIIVAFAVNASAGAVSTTEDRPQASEAATSKATVKSLKRQLKMLTTRVVALEEKKFPGSLPPSGPARGDLAGSYPNPTIANNAVGPGKIPDETLTGFEIAPDSLFANDLATDSVGASELKALQVRVSIGTAVPAGEIRAAHAVCLVGEQVTGGGFAWQTNQAGTSIIASTPEYSPAGHLWVAAGRATQANTLYAWALCLPA